MPSLKPLPYSIALAITAIAYPQITHANSSTLAAGEIWNCTADNTGWHCDKAAAPTPRLINRTALTSEVQAPVATSAASLPSYKNLDWSTTAPSNTACPGAYVEPQFIAQGDEEEANPAVYLDAGSTTSELGADTRLRGGVNIRQGKRRLSSDEARVSPNQDTAALSGNVVFREPGLLVVSDSAEASLTDNTASFKQARFVLHESHLRGEASSLQRNADETITLTDSTYTYCPPGNQDWAINADELHLDQQAGQGVAKHTTLRVADVPVMYVPYFSFPIDDRRKSGFLYPTASYAQLNGLDIAAPYYFNIAPEYDDTLTPHWISERGVLLENELRYLNRYSENVLNIGYLPDDDLYNDDRWLLNTKHSGRNAAGWHSRIDFTRVSDDSYFDDLNTELSVARQDHLDQIGEVSFYGDSWNAAARVQSYQTISGSQSPYRRLPQLEVKGNTPWQGYGLGYQAEYVYFDRDTAGLTGSDKITGQRIHITPELRRQFSNSYAYITPSLRLWNTYYQLEDQLVGAQDNPSYSVPVLSIDSGLTLERTRNQGGIQTLEPRLFALYAPHENQDDAPLFDTTALDFSYDALFRDNRFSGRDRIGDAQQLSLGLTSRLYNSRGFEQGSLSLAQAFYFDDRKVTLSGSDETEKRSDFALQANWNVNRKLRLTLDSALAASDLDLNESNLHLRYKSDLDHRFYARYRYEKDVREQSDIHLLWPLASKWSFVGRWQHDYLEKQDLESVIGVEYDSCCWSVQLVGRRWIVDTDEHNNGVFLRFTLKGLGALGSSSAGFLNDITGFEERDDQDDY